jgi:hypothetical protein
MSLCGISIVDDSVIFASGAYWGFPRVIRSTDKGATWTTSTLSPYAGALVDCYFFNKDSGFVVGGTDSVSMASEALVLSTSNGGSTWDVSHAGTSTGELCWKISFPSATIGYVSIQNSGSSPTHFLKTTNRGATWEEALFSSNHFDFQGIGFLSPSIGWIGGQATYKTTDGGDNWQPGLFGLFINRFRFLSDSLGYAVGRTVYKYSSDTTTTGSQNDQTPVPLTGALLNGFPNPFNSTTTLHYMLGIRSHVSLKVFDLLGVEIATLIDQVRSPGVYETTFYAANLTSGVYVCRLQVGSFVETRKLVLLK